MDIQETGRLTFEACSWLVQPKSCFSAMLIMINLGKYLSDDWCYIVALLTCKVNYITLAAGRLQIAPDPMKGDR